MTGRLHIVTDSGARFSNPRLIQHYPVTILPNQIEIGGNRYREGVDLTDDEALRLIETQTQPPTIIPPSTKDYADAFNRLSRSNDAIISIHPSREINDSWQNAREAAHQLSGGSCEIVVVDSRSICAGQGMLVRVATRGIQEKQSVETIIQSVRDAVDRIYSLYYVNSVNYLQQQDILSESHAILGDMLSIKPFLSIEEGKLVVIEKVKSRSQAIDRLVEFLVEFTELDDAVILQHKSHMSEQTRIMQDRLALEFPGQHFPYTMYSAPLACLLGTDATGVAVLESEMEAE